MKKLDFYCKPDRESLIKDKINEIVDWINKSQPTVCVYGCGKFKDLRQHYIEKHPKLK